jgi:hypothetical protein
MNKQDLTQYSDGELSLHVFNDEYLYRQRNSRHLKELLNEIFIFTDGQWEELENDLKEDEE